MKILHVCSVAYIDGWGYQDNLLPDYMSKAGHDVVVVAPANKFPAYLKDEEKGRIVVKGKEYYYGKIHIYRNKVGFSTSNYVFVWHGLTDVLNKEKPDAIFHHGINSSSMLICWKYIVAHTNCRFFVDNHADHINESNNKIWNFAANNLLKLCVKIIQKKVKKFYGVTPGRCDYMKEIYGVKREKIDLYPIGFDIDTIQNISCDKQKLRDKYGIPGDAFIIITGGKMGKDKGTISLMHAYQKLHQNIPNLILVMFGRFMDDNTLNIAKNTDGVFVNGWCDRTKTLELLKLSDIACWPLHHTTLIEDAVGSGLPVIIRKTSNTSHLIDGNGEFLISGDEVEIYESLQKLLKEYKVYSAAAQKMIMKYSYRNLVSLFEQDCLL